MSWLKNIFQSLGTTGSFVQNAAFMFSASAGGMLVQILFMPLLSRIYDPEAYGLFGVFNAVLVIAGVATTRAFNQAFVLPKSEPEFRALFSLALRSGLVGGMVLTGISLALSPWLTSWSVTAELGYWWLALGPLLVLLVLDRLMMDWSIREKAFKRQSVWSVPIALTSKGFNASYGHFYSATADGHILTTALHYLLRIGVFLKWIIPNALPRLKERSTPSHRKAAAVEYADYPRYTLWGNLLNTASGYIPVLMLPWVLSDIRTAGYFTFAFLLLDIPIRLMTSGITPVYMNKAAEIIRNRPEELGPLTAKLFRNMMVPSAVGMAILYATGEWVYVFAFGEPWRMAGQAAELLSVFYFFRLISSPISPVINILRKEQELLRFQGFLFVLRCLSLAPGLFWDWSFLELMLCYSLVNALSFAALTQRIFGLIRYQTWRLLGEACVTFGVCLLLAHLLKTA